MIREILEKMSFTAGQVDQCVFTRKTGTEVIYILLYVDDLLVASVNASLVEQFKGELKKLVEIRG